MRMFFTVLLVLLAASGALAQSDQGVLPGVEAVFTVDGGFRFASPALRTPGPSFIDWDTDGEIQIVLHKTTSVPGDPSRTVVDVKPGDPSWGDEVWPSATPVGNAYYTLLGKVRGFDIRGADADSMTFTIVSGTYLAVSCSVTR